MDSDSTQLAATMKQMMPLITFGLVMGYLSILAIFWGLGVVLAKGQGPSLMHCLSKGMQRMQEILGKHPMLFGGAMLLMIANVVGSVMLSSNKSEGADLGAMMGSIMLALLSMVISFASSAMSAICQFLTFKNNKAIDQPDAPPSSKGDVSLFFHFFAAQILASLAMGFATMFFVIPGIIVAILTFVVGPLAVVETRAASAVGRSIDLVKGKFWSVTKLAMPILIIVAFPSLTLFTLGKALGDGMVHNALAALVAAVTFILAAISWNCQSEIYNYLTKE